MRVGINLGPTDDWAAMLAATRAADDMGFEAIGFLDHYHADHLDWPYICGWSAYGALAMATKRIHFVPTVLDRMNYLPGVLAKESATLAMLSNGRFELGIGAGDFFEEIRAWGLELPNATARITGLRETVQVLRRIWQGEQVTFDGELLHLRNAAISPIPSVLPRVVVGVGNSRRLIHDAVAYADELNVYADEEIIRFAQAEIAISGRAVALSVFVWDWLDDIVEKARAWEQQGIDRVFVTCWHPFLDGLEHLRTLL